MTQSVPAGAQPATPGGSSGLAALPAVWVGIVVLLSIYGVWQAGFGAYYISDIPDRILYFIYAGFAVAAVNLLWGLYLLALAVSRSPRFPRNFIVWQIANIAWVALRQAYVLIVPDFMVAIMPLVYTFGEIAIGVFLIQLLTGKGAVAGAYAGDIGERPSPILVVVAAILGVVVGAAVGFGIGLGGGIAFSELTNMSCFEGACGYFAFFMGLFGLIIGAIAGGILAVWLILRRRKGRQSDAAVSN
jgi:hypothetical protein